MILYVFAFNREDIRRSWGPLSTFQATFTVNNGGIFHVGPLLFYMAKAPSTVNGWDGSGNVWFKIGQIGAQFSGGRMTWPANGECILSRHWLCGQGFQLIDPTRS